MKAVGLTEYGGPEVLHLVDLPLPEPGAGELRIKVTAAAIHPADLMLRKGALAEWYGDTPKPYVPGMDIAGVVDAFGPGAKASSGLTLGAKVVALVNTFGTHGGYSEYVVLPAASVAAAPRGISAPQAASFLMPAMTARAGLDMLALQKGDALLVAGAAGAVGRFVVALAHADGLRVIALADESDAAMLRDLGADTLVPRSADFAQAMQAVAPEGVAGLFDTTPAHAQHIPALRDGGSVVSTSADPGDPGRGIRTAMVNVRNHMTDHAAIARLRDMAENGQLPLNVAATFPATKAVAAHQLFDASGQAKGRILILF
ncbi:MAG: NADP-dependent oxidoreductase [Paracoccus sp. (in: a-proteobacteria)]|uniref:NADP-dependent oxidoreductase n=1 Tax=Paracoccus sp. TaxID=267 RepID=UPI0026DF24B2|nr:NADP-dependent oxidoreductase [Paracoccus sp. (in: a-proteobacteria)]MDO5631257.1 NADP-dependent oxidoreductase [Paracoccus sp. (in: a-proteobacteria)]